MSMFHLCRLDTIMWSWSQSGYDINKTSMCYFKCFLLKNGRKYFLLIIRSGCKGGFSQKSETMGTENRPTKACILWASLSIF